jgi:hypothetical protein
VSPLRAPAPLLAVILACGPEPGGTTTDLTTSSTTTAASTVDTPTTSGTTADATTGAPACAGASLPQPLPASITRAYWLLLEDVNEPEGAVQFYFTIPPGLCTDDPTQTCTPDGKPTLAGYYVVLDPEHRVPGVYPVEQEFLDDGVFIGALVSRMDGDDGDCNLDLIVPAARDGEVEVLADDDDCIAIDVRGVTPIEYEGLHLDPNGSGTADRCAL